MTNSIFESLQIFFFFSLCENVSRWNSSTDSFKSKNVKVRLIHVRSYFICWGVSFQRISIQKKRDHPFCDKWGGESSKSRIFRDNSEVEFCRKFKSLLWQKITQDFFTSGLVRVLVCFPFHRIHWDLMPVMFMRCFFVFLFVFFFKNITDTLACPSFTTFLFLRYVYVMWDSSLNRSTAT